MKFAIAVLAICCCSILNGQSSESFNFTGFNLSSKRINKLSETSIKSIQNQPVFWFSSLEEIKPPREKLFSSAYFKKNYFSSLEFVFFSEGGDGPKASEARKTEDGTKYETYSNLISVAYAPRLNLLNHRDWASLSIDVPVTVGLMLADIDEGPTIGFKLPVFISGNLFCHSTYNNINAFGMRMGVGWQLTNIGAFSSERETVMWSSLLCRFGVIFPAKKNNLFGIDLTLPLFGLEDRDIFALSISKLLNYE